MVALLDYISIEPFSDAKTVVGRVYKILQHADGAKTRPNPSGFTEVYYDRNDEVIGFSSHSHLKRLTILESHPSWITDTLGSNMWNPYFRSSLLEYMSLIPNGTTFYVGAETFITLEDPSGLGMRFVPIKETTRRLTASEALVYTGWPQDAPTRKSRGVVHATTVQIIHTPHVTPIRLEYPSEV